MNNGCFALANSGFLCHALKMNKVKIKLLIDLSKLNCFVREEQS